jgi:hypothetical protein
MYSLQHCSATGFRYGESTQRPGPELGFSKKKKLLLMIGSWITSSHKLIFVFLSVILFPAAQEMILPIENETAIISWRGSIFPIRY